MRTLLVLFALTLFSFNIYGQNYLFRPKQSGGFVSGDFGVGSGAYLAGGTVGYSYRGRLSLALSGLHRGGEHILTINSLTAATNYMIIKQDKFPISIAIDASYSFRGTPSFTDQKSHSFSFGACVFRRQQFSDKFSMIPGVTLSFVEYREGSAREAGALNRKIITVQNSFQFNRFIITPGLSHTADLWTFLTSFAYIIPFKNHL